MVSVFVIELTLYEIIMKHMWTISLWLCLYFGYIIRNYYIQIWSLICRNNEKVLNENLKCDHSKYVYP